jgi:putative transposase
VESRFGAHRAAHLVEMLSDNGPPYTARDTRIFASRFGLRPCFTPVDYVHVTPLPDPETVLDLVGGWIEDYKRQPPAFRAEDALAARVHRSSTETA